MNTGDPGLAATPVAVPAHRAPRPWAWPWLPVASALALEALTLVSLPGFLAIRSPAGAEMACLCGGAALGHLSAGGHRLGPRARLLVLAALLGGAAVGWAVAAWRSAAARHFLSSLWLQLRFLDIAWRSGALPPVPTHAGWLLLVVGGWAAGAVVAQALRSTSPLPTVGAILGFLALEWEFLDRSAASLWWPAAGLGLIWVAAARPRLGGGPDRRRGSGAAVLRAAATAAALVLVVAQLPLNRPPGNVGALASWANTHVPVLQRLTAGMRLRAATMPAAAGYGLPLAPAAPYSIGEEGFGASSADLGGPLTDTGAQAMLVTVRSGTPPPVLYLSGVAFNTYTGRGWVEGPRTLRTAPPPALQPFGFGTASAGRSSFRLLIRPTGLVTSTLFTVLTPLQIAGVAARWDRTGNAWANQPLAPGTQYRVEAIAPRSPAQLAARQALPGAPPGRPLGNRGGVGRAGGGVRSGGRQGFGPLGGGATGTRRGGAGTAVAGSGPGDFAGVFGGGLGGGFVGRFGGGFGGRRRFHFFLPGLARQLAADTQLPTTLPPRVRTLAETWTAGAVTPLQKALALQEHLLRIPYSLNAPAPPPGRDFVDFFLFTAHEGYCTYYASALAVMLRALGIPSRWVTGFTVPTPPPGHSAVVSDSNAHAWVEAFILPYGWLLFDPTPPGPTLRTPATTGAASSAAATPAAGSGAGSVPAAISRVAGLVGAGASRLGRPGRWAVPVLLALALCAAALRALRRRRWDPANPVASAGRLWSEVERLARWAGGFRAPRPPAGLTPAELAQHMIRSWPGCAPELRAMATAYGRCRFGPPDGRAAAAGVVRQAWLALHASWRREATLAEQVGAWLPWR